MENSWKLGNPTKNRQIAYVTIRGPFGSNRGFIDAIAEYLGEQEDSFYFGGVSKLEQHWRKYIKTKGDYIEK